jgi:hypothetical protein
MPCIATLRALVAAGATAEAIVDFIEAQAAEKEEKRRKKEERRRKDRERKRRERERAAEFRVTSADISGIPRDVTVEPHVVVESPPPDPQPVVSAPAAPPADTKSDTLSFLLPSSEDSSLGKRGSENARARSNDRAEFELWYSGYPHKVGKARASPAFLKARKKASLEILIEGRDRYVREKPPDRAWCNPATWLNEERWNDEPAPNGGKDGRDQQGSRQGGFIALRRAFAQKRANGNGHSPDMFGDGIAAAIRPNGGS